MEIGTAAVIVSAAGVFCTTAIGVFQAVIAKTQRDIARGANRRALFDLRYAIYAEASELVRNYGDLAYEGLSSDEFRAKFGRAAFVFDESVLKLLLRMHEELNLSRFRLADRKANPDPADPIPGRILQILQRDLGVLCYDWNADLVRVLGPYLKIGSPGDPMEIEIPRHLSLASDEAPK